MTTMLEYKGKRAAVLASMLCFAVFAAPAAIADASPSGEAEDSAAVDDQSSGTESPVTDDQVLGGPSSVPGQIRDDAEARKRTERAAARQARKDRLKDRYGLSLHADYNALYQKVNESDGDDSATSGALRFYGTWAPLRKGEASSGALVFKAENRHVIGSGIANQVLLPGAGYAGVSGPTFSDAGTILTNFYWTQSFADQRVAFNAGVVDVTDYIDIFGLINVWTDFNNLAFSTSVTLPAPSQGLGAVGLFRFTDNYYIEAGIADANGNPHEPGDFFHSFFNVGEYFKHVEVGWIQSWGQRYTDKAHLTVWQVDEREEAGVASGHGATLSYSRMLNQRWMPFIRGGYADGGGTFLERFVSVGAGYLLDQRNDFIGFGASWGKAPEDFGQAASDRDQYTFELYYRWQPFPALQIVPSVQYIIDPALDPAKDDLFVAGLRVRAVF